ncbi:hypothetical protein GS682_20670 [Nostoc sp. B(2019)]|nr:hypothetical protein [Nostoc sp. B(2019)]
MKIAIMGAWNSDSGVSIHAEAIGREFLRMGHKLVVFSFIFESFHGSALIKEDEPYVYRCFSTCEAKPVFFNDSPFLKEDYDVFIVEDLGMLPKYELKKIFNLIRKKALVLTVIHDGKPSSDPLFYEFQWNGVICFDYRYMNFLREVYPQEILKCIEFPFLPWNIGNKCEAREKLQLPKQKKIVFMFGLAANSTYEIIPWLNKIKKEYDIHVVIVSNAMTKRNLLKLLFFKLKYFDLSKRIVVELRRKTLSIEDLYHYLSAADVMIYDKHSAPHVVVSSTIYQCLGSGCPILARESNFTEMIQDFIFTYSNFESFREKIRWIFTCNNQQKDTLMRAKNHIDHHSASHIASKFIEYFKYLSVNKNISSEAKQ